MITRPGSAARTSDLRGSSDLSNRPCELSIVMPCLDEAETVGACVRKARAFLDSRGIHGEVLVADNGSTDGSRAVASREGARVVPVSRKGYGNALLGGIRAAHGEFVIMGDADDSYDFTRLGSFVQALRNGNDLVMGNRFRGGIRDGAMPFLNRYLGNPVLSFLGRLFFRSPVGDFHCGLRGFRKDAILDLGLTTSGMEFASEMVVKATLRGLSITEVPTTLSPDGRSSTPHLRRWRDGWRHLKFLLLLAPRWLFLYPGMILALAGTTMMIALLRGPVHLGSVSFDVNTLVYCAVAILGGFQLFSLNVFAKIFATRIGLFPEDPWTRRFKSWFRLGPGFATAAALVLVGVFISSYAVHFWSDTSFGPLDPQRSLRFVVPAATAIVLGILVASSSFFVTLLNLEDGDRANEGRGSFVTPER